MRHLLNTVADAFVVSRTKPGTYPPSKANSCPTTILGELRLRGVAAAGHGGGRWHFSPYQFCRRHLPETWNAAYVQPCRRPADGRYGENPNRLQHYYQFQVVVEAFARQYSAVVSPDSLKTLGIDFTVHDVRFVEDNWGIPTLGLGLGSVAERYGTQFTHFQQVGGLECFPSRVKSLTAWNALRCNLQGVDSILICADDRSTRQDLVTLRRCVSSKRREMSHFNFEQAKCGFSVSVF